MSQGLYAKWPQVWISSFIFILWAILQTVYKQPILASYTILVIFFHNIWVLTVHGLLRRPDKKPRLAVFGPRAVLCQPPIPHVPDRPHHSSQKGFAHPCQSLSLLSRSLFQCFCISYVRQKVGLKMMKITCFLKSGFFLICTLTNLLFFSSPQFRLTINQG